MTARTSRGTAVAISTTAAASTIDTIAEVEGLTWTDVGEIETIGPLGDTANLVNFVSIDDARVRKLPGARDAGTMTVTCAFDIADTGQTAMKTAQTSDNEYGFRVTRNDTPAGGTTPTIQYFRGRVGSERIETGGADDVTKIVFDVAANSAIYTDVAA
jgi:hypothetical protein